MIISEKAQQNLDNYDVLIVTYALKLISKISLKTKLKVKWEWVAVRILVRDNSINGCAKIVSKKVKEGWEPITKIKIDDSMSSYEEKTKDLTQR